MHTLFPTAHRSDHWYNVFFYETLILFLFGCEWFVSHFHSTEQEFSNGLLEQPYYVSGRCGSCGYRAHTSAVLICLD
jgi:hypothetical protein